MEEGRETDGERNRKRHKERDRHTDLQRGRKETGGTKRDRETKKQRKRDTQRQKGSKPKHLLLKETEILRHVGRETETRVKKTIPESTIWESLSSFYK